MQRDDFERDSALVEFCQLGRWLFFRADMELYDTETGESETFASFDDLFEVSGFAGAVGSLDSVLIEPDGGRGSTSASGAAGDEREFKFSNAQGGGEKSIGQKKFPAEFNDGEKEQSFDKALSKFRDRHANSDVEYAIAVDDMGYVHQYVQGGSTSVAIRGRDGQMIIHNHPSGGNFSKADMLSTAQAKGEKGIVASGKNGDYIFRKGSHFDSSGFAKAVNSARPRGKSYDDAIGKWLTENQKKFGYTYQFKKA